MALGVPILKHFRVLPNIWDYGKSGQTLGSRQNGHFTPLQVWLNEKVLELWKDQYSLRLREVGISVFTVKILKFGTPQTIAIIVLKLVKFDVTLH